MEGQKYLKYCSECAKIDDIPGAKYHVHGYKSFYDSDEVENCLECGNKLIQLSMPCEDYNILTHVSTDPDFMDSMVKLHDTDPIEFQLKMSQLKANLGQQESAKVQTEKTNNNKVKCPYCKSIDCTKISNIKKATKIGLFGIFGTGDLGKTWKCNNCSSKW